MLIISQVDIGRWEWLATGEGDDHKMFGMHWTRFASAGCWYCWLLVSHGILPSGWLPGKLSHDDNSFESTIDSGTWKSFSCKIHQNTSKCCSSVLWPKFSRHYIAIVLWELPPGNKFNIINREKEQHFATGTSCTGGHQAVQCCFLCSKSDLEEWVQYRSYWRSGSFAWWNSQFQRSIRWK